MKVYFETNKGLLREINEDNFLIQETKRFNLYAVADGMGGHKAGEVASSLAIDTIKQCFDSDCMSDNFMVPKFINDSIQLANKKIREESFEKEEYNGMGTTVTMAVVDLEQNIAYIGNIGDSRAYLLKDDEIIQLTEDHTYVNELLKDGRITTEEAKNHPKRNIITRAVGSEEDMLVDIFEIEFLKNEALLICSDGLTTHINDEEILNTIVTYGCSKSVQRLIDLSNDNGGTDNITLIIVDNNYRGDNL